jgi:hypothetical protein
MLRKSLAVIIFIWALTSVGCSRTVKPPAMEARLSAGENTPNQTRLFQRETLTAVQTNALADFILPEIRTHLDAEPVSQDELPVYDSVPEYSDGESVDTSETVVGEDGVTNPDELEKLRYSWAKKKYGEALKKDETARGVLVLYADENYYDIGRLTAFIEEGRNRIAGNAEIDSGRIQVVYGGYRGLAQVECWIVPQGENLPELKPENRETAASEK